MLVSGAPEGWAAPFNRGPVVVAQPKVGVVQKQMLMAQHLPGVHIKHCWFLLSSLWSAAVPGAHSWPGSLSRCAAEWPLHLQHRRSRPEVLSLITSAIECLANNTPENVLWSQREYWFCHLNKPSFLRICQVSLKARDTVKGETSC